MFLNNFAHLRRQQEPAKEMNMFAYIRLQQVVNTLALIIVYANAAIVTVHEAFLTFLVVVGLFNVINDVFASLGLNLEEFRPLIITFNHVEAHSKATVVAVLDVPHTAAVLPFLHFDYSLEEFVSKEFQDVNEALVDPLVFLKSKDKFPFWLFMTEVLYNFL